MEQKETVTTNTSAGEFYNEAFDVKLLRTRMVPNPRCPKCHNWGHHHRPQCESATRGDALRHMEEAQKREKHARERAAEWMSACRQMHGKIAMLKHENNKLRKKVAPQPDRAAPKEPRPIHAGYLWNALPWEDKEAFLLRHGFKAGWASHTWQHLDRPIQGAWEGRCP
jgi:hypothetical protein